MVTVITVRNDSQWLILLKGLWFFDKTTVDTSVEKNQL